MPIRKETGATLLEVLITTMIASLMVGVMVVLFQKISVVTRQNSIKSQLHIEAQTASDAIAQFLGRAQAYSLVLTQKTGAPPYSQVDFTVNDSSRTIYSVYLSPGDVSSLYTLVMATKIGTSPWSTKILSNRAIEFGVSCPQGCTQNPHLLDMKLSLQQRIDSRHTATVRLKSSNITVLAH